MIPTLASCSFDEMVDARQGDQVQWLQLYVNKDRKVTERIVKHAEKRGCKGLFITVDAPQVSCNPYPSLLVDLQSKRRIYGRNGGREHTAGLAPDVGT